MAEIATSPSALPRVTQATLREPRPVTPTDDLTRAIERAREALLDLQVEDGHWCAELEGDTILESEYVLLLVFLGKRRDPRIEMACRYLRQQQTPSGGWAIYRGGPDDVSSSTKAYVALRLAGDDPSAEHMSRAAGSIRAMGGLRACNSYTKLYLSIFGLWRWSDSPAVPPELMLLPRWCYFNLYEMSSWSRAIVVPLSVLWAVKPQREVDFDLAELVSDVRPPRKELSAWYRAWARVFLGIDRCIKGAEALGLFRLTRARALSRAQSWFVERLERSEGLAAIFPAMVNSVMALVALGHDVEDELVVQQLAELARFEIIEGETLRLQPCFSPVWDTALSLNALLESGSDANEPSIVAGLRWLLDKEVDGPGDWQERVQDVEPSGWFFEYRNEFYPDCDDTAEILAILARARLTNETLEARKSAAIRRALKWQTAMQNRDGGWGAFDRGCDKELLTLIPFADHNAMIDPSTSDITARSIEALVACGRDVTSKPVRAALAFLEREQEVDGSWYGRWGSNYIYGTWLSLCALGTVGRTIQSCASARRGAEWLLGVQNADGGWGESLHSYADPAAKGRGPSTASQTAWAMLGLIAVAPCHGDVAEAVGRGAELLLERQLDGGAWHDEEWTGTGFPTVFYLRYHLYAHHFPLHALAAYREWSKTLVSPAPSWRH